MDLPDPRGAELFEAGDLGIDVGGVDVDVHPTGAVVETLDEDRGVLAGDLAPVVFGVAHALGQRPAGGSRPEGELLVVVSGSHVDDDLVDPAVVRHRHSLQLLAQVNRASGGVHDRQDVGKVHRSRPRRGDC